MGPEWLCRENKTLERIECVFTESGIQSKLILSQCLLLVEWDKVLLMCSVDIRLSAYILWMLSDQFIQITP